MGRQAYPIIGGIIGAVVVGIVSDGTATAQGYQAGFAIGAALGGIAGSYIDPVLIQGNTIGDNNIQSASEGGTRAMVFGQGCVQATCVIARGNRKVTKKKTSNGKGSSGSTQSESVSWTFAIAIGEAIPNSMITRIWQDENLVYDITSVSTMSSSDNNKFRQKFRYYDGSETQLPDPDLQVFLEDQTPYFRGTAYVVFPNFDLTQTAERVPTFKFEVVNHPEPLNLLNTLDVELHGYSFLTKQTKSVTINDLPEGIVYHVDLFIQAEMETRQYNTYTGTVGGNGHFITASSDTSSGDQPSNIYKVEVDDPPQTYYLNMRLIGDVVSTTLIYPGTSEQSRLQIVIKRGSTVTFTADPVDGLQGGGSGSQFIKCLSNNLALFDDGAATPVSLSSVVSTLMQRAGMTSDQFDLDVLNDTMISGVVVQQTASGAEAISSIVSPFFFDPCESDTVLRYVARGQPVLRVLTIDDLTEEPEVANRNNAIEYPAKLSFFYQAPQTGYAMTKATAYRYSAQSDSVGEGSVTAPVTFQTADEPARIAQKLLKVMWAEAEGTFQWKVGSHCIDLVPTDVVALDLRGIITRARIVAIENDGATISLSMTKDRQSAYTSNVTTIPLPKPTKPLPTTMSKAVLAVLDIPPLTDADDVLGYYTAMSGSTNVWSGGQVQLSLDGGSSWTAIGEFTTDTTMGRLTVAMTAADAGYTDTTNTVTVQLFDSANELHAQTDTSFLAQGGAVAVQLADGSWELMQYRDVLDNGSGSWTLSYLQRGRKNTVAGDHDVGSLFLLIDTTLEKDQGQVAWLGTTLEHRGVSYGTSSEDADIVSTTYVGRSQLEWSPASATAQFDGTYVSVDNIVPRHHLGSELNPIASVNFQGFRVTITDGTHTATSDTTSSSAFVDMTTLTGDPTSVTVQALNKLTGAGQSLIITDIEEVAAGSLTPEAVINAGGN